MAGWFVGSGGFATLTAAPPGVPSAVVDGEQLFDDSMRSTAELSAGLTTFRFATSDAKQGHTILLVRMPDDGTITEYLDGLRKLSSGEHETGRMATKFDQSNLGGGVVGAKCRVNLTVVLEAGTYYLLAFNGPGVSDPSPRIQEVRVTGTAKDAKLPRQENEIVLDANGGNPRFDTDDRWPADGAFLVANNVGITSEAVLLPLKPGTTDEELRAFFVNDNEELDWMSAPFSEFAVCGMPPVSPGGRVVAQLSAPPGEYVLVSFTTDMKQQKRMYQLGMYKRVRIAPQP